jgi:hypothetical protein
MTLNVASPFLRLSQSHSKRILIYMRPPSFDTAQLSLVRTPFDDPDFLFELKHDGFRALAPETSAYLKQHGAVCAKKPNH